MAIANYLTKGLGQPAPPPASPYQPGQFNYSSTASPFAGAQSGTQTVQDSLASFLDPNSDYIQNARRRGAEYAATRGGINSSIAAGAAERSAVEAATPLVDKAMQIEATREGALTADWINSQGFNREMASVPYQNSMQMLQSLQQFALQDPQLYTPSVVSGFSNFFNRNMNDTIRRYFNG